MVGRGPWGLCEAQGSRGGSDRSPVSEGGGRRGRGAGVSTGSRPSSGRPGPSASGKASRLASGRGRPERFPTSQPLGKVQEPEVEPPSLHTHTHPPPGLTNRKKAGVALFLSLEGPGPSPGASFLEEEAIDKDRDPHPPPGLLLARSSGGSPPTPEWEGRAGARRCPLPTLHCRGHSCPALHPVWSLVRGLPGGRPWMDPGQPREVPR